MPRSRRSSAQSPITPRLNIRNFSVSTQVQYLVKQEVARQLKDLEEEIREVERAIMQLNRRMSNSQI